MRLNDSNDNSVYSGDWRPRMFGNQYIYFDMRSKTDRNLFDRIMHRRDVNWTSGTVVDFSLRSQAPVCEKCGFDLIAYDGYDYVYGVACPLCGTPAKPLPEYLKGEPCR